MIRGGHLDLALLGAFEVAENGDLANWTTDDPGFPPGVGGAMDLAVGAKEIRVLLEHTTKSGMPRIRRRCEYPLTAASAVRRIYTDLAVIDVTGDGLVVREIADDIDFAALQTKTEAGLRAAPDLKPLRAPLSSDTDRTGAHRLAGDSSPASLRLDPLLRCRRGPARRAGGWGMARCVRASKAGGNARGTRSRCRCRAGA